VSQLDSTSGASPTRGVVKKPPTNIYTVLMILATVAMSLGCLFLAMEYAKYGF